MCERESEREEKEGEREREREVEKGRKMMLYHDGTVPHSEGVHEYMPFTQVTYGRTKNA